MLTNQQYYSFDYLSSNKCSLEHKSLLLYIKQHKENVILFYFFILRCKNKDGIYSICKFGFPKTFAHKQSFFIFFMLFS